MNLESEKWNRRFAPKHLLVAVILLAVFATGYWAGTGANGGATVPEGEGRVLNTGTDRADDIDFGLFWTVWDMVKEDHVKQPVSEQDLFYGALHGLVEGLGDDYSQFFTSEENEEFNATIDGTFSGIGAEIDSKDSYIVVVSPLKDSPAENAGLQAGDFILAVDGQTTFEMSVMEAVSIIRGDKGTSVTLTITRGEGEARDITIVRDDITIDSVEWELRDDGIMVISMYMFNQDSTRLFTEAVQEALEADAKGLVLDLRNNPGGLLAQAINIAGFWVGNQTVVIESDRRGDTPLASNRQATLKDMPTVVLVNGGSASASEILAGALQDYGLAHVIGEQTFGKGTVQELRDLKGGSALKITVAEWLTPNRRSIQESGITPDEVVELTEEDINAEKTPQLDSAIRYLKTR